jgi:guanosine-3',5'-bis(diphosphate) 3'-pyrophosphohydrolase
MPQSQPTQTGEKIISASELIRLVQNPTTDDIKLIEKAYSFAQAAHKDHTRQSGEPYMTHLVETARILAELGSRPITIAAGLLHDCIEDTSVERQEIVEEFGEEISFIVEGVTKLGHLKYRGGERHKESLRKLFVAMSQDIRVLMIKLADRLHNMRTLSHLPEEKRGRIAQETLEIYAPIAYRLGIRRLNRELEDLAFPYVFPNEYEEMKKVLKQKHSDSTESLEKFSRSIKKALAKEGLVKIKVDYRVKGLYSFYKKLLRNDHNVEKIYDINAIRILVDSVGDCYQVLGIVHAHWRPLPNRIKDYIAFPKTNGYQGLHTTVFTGDKNIVEVQIKTHDMHKHSEYGIASHMSYKASGNKDALAWVHALLPKIASKTAQEEVVVDLPSWIKELAEYEEPSKDHKLFKERLTSDFFNERIFVFTPKGDVIDLPVDSTPIDFAYSIHSDIGNHMNGSKVNGKLVGLDTKLKNGDIVEIMTRESAKPNRKWLESAKTSLARRHIRGESPKFNDGFKQ